MARPRKKERNRAVYEEWLRGDYGTYKRLGLRYALDASDCYKIVHREKQELAQIDGDNSIEDSK